MNMPSHDAEHPARWFETLADLYGKKLTRSDAVRWSEIIKADFPGITEAEIITALRWSVDNFRRKSKYQPDYPEMRDMIRAYRARPRYNTDGITTSNRVLIINARWTDDGAHRIEIQETQMAELKRMLNSNPPPDEAWNLICAPSDNAQNRELEAYCRNHGIAYGKYRPDYSGVRAAVDVMATRAR